MTEIMLLENAYAAPRVGSRAREGRAIREAKCGHRVYVSPRGLDAISRRGKTLWCEPCLSAQAREAGARLAVWDGPVEVLEGDPEEPPSDAG